MRLSASYRGERFTLNMGLGHTEFFRTLPAALEGMDYTVDGDAVSIDDGPRHVRIRLGPEQQRRIALLAVTHTDVSFEFDGYDQGGIDTFMTRFMARYQRGGG